MTKDTVQQAPKIEFPAPIIPLKSLAIAAKLLLISFLRWSNAMPETDPAAIIQRDSSNGLLSCKCTFMRSIEQLEKINIDLRETGIVRWCSNVEICCGAAVRLYGL